MEKQIEKLEKLKAGLTDKEMIASIEKRIEILKKRKIVEK
jgi:hypothetical protein